MNTYKPMSVRAFHHKRPIHTLAPFKVRAAAIPLPIPYGTVSNILPHHVWCTYQCRRQLRCKSLEIDMISTQDDTMERKG